MYIPIKSLIRPSKYQQSISSTQSDQYEDCYRLETPKRNFTENY